MANTAVTNVKMALNTVKEYATTAATVDTADGKEVFDVTPSKSDGKVLILIANTSALNGSLTASVAAGGFWAAGSALEVTVEQGKTKMLELESAKYLGTNGKYAVTLTPATGKKLKTDHTASVGCVELI
jgi:hypothetical protein